MIKKTLHKLGPSLNLSHQKPAANIILHGEVLGATIRRECLIAATWEAPSSVYMQGIQVSITPEDT